MARGTLTMDPLQLASPRPPRFEKGKPPDEAALRAWLAGFGHDQATIDRAIRSAAKSLRHPLTRHIWQEIYTYSGNFLLLFDGKPGTGKSMAAVRLSERFDPDFRASERTVFDMRDLLRLLGSDENGAITGTPLPRGSAYVVEEAGVLGPSRQHLSRTNQLLSFIYQTTRKLGHLVTFTVPDRAMVDRHIRLLAHAEASFMKVKGRPGSAWIIKPGREPGKEEPHSYYDALRGRTWTFWKRQRFRLPSQDAVRSYEVKKDQFLRQLTARMAGEVGGAAAALSAEGAAGHGRPPAHVQAPPAAEEVPESVRLFRSFFEPPPVTPMPPMPARPPEGG